MNFESYPSEETIFINSKILYAVRWRPQWLLCLNDTKNVSYHSENTVASTCISSISVCIWLIEMHILKILIHYLFGFTKPRPGHMKALSHLSVVWLLNDECSPCSYWLTITAAYSIWRLTACWQVIAIIPFWLFYSSQAILSYFSANCLPLPFK